MTEIINLTFNELSNHIEMYRRFLQDANLRDHLNERDLDYLVQSYYEDGSVS